MFMLKALRDLYLNPSQAVVVLYASGFLDFFGVSMLMPLISTHVRDLGASSTVAGLVGSVYGGIQLFSSPIVGQWSDVSGRRWCLFICMLMTAFGYLFMGFSSSIFLMVLARIPTGIFKHSQSISKAYIADVMSHEKRSSVQGKFNSCSSIGFILGPVIGGHIAETSWGFYGTAYFCSALFFINSFLVWALLPDSKSRPHPSLIRDESTVSLKKLASEEYSVNPPSFVQAMKSLNWPKLWDLFAIRFFLGFSVLLFRSNFSLILRDQFQLTPKFIGYLISYSGTVSAVCGLFVGPISRWYNNDARLYLHMCIVLVLTMSLLSIVPSLWLFTIFLTPLSFSTTNLRVVGISLMVNRGDKKEIGVLVGLSQTVTSTARMISPLLSGILLEINPGVPSFFGAAMGVLALGIIAYRWQFFTPEKTKTE